MSRESRRRLGAGARTVLATGLAAGAQVSSVALLLTSGWLVVRAAEQPPVLYLLVAVTSVRMFGVSRAVLRYAERLVSHDVALERAVEARVGAYRALDRAAPAGLAGLRHGEVVQRVVQDVERTQDRLLRVRLPWTSAAATTTLLVAVTAWLLPAAGLVLALQALLVAVIVRWVLPRTRGRSSAGLELTQEDRLAGRVTELTRTAPDLLAYGSSRERAEQAHAVVDAMARLDRGDTGWQGRGTALVLASTALSLLAVVVLVPGASVPASVVGVLVLAPLGLAEVLESLVEAERHRPAVEAAQRRLDALETIGVPVATAGRRTASTEALRMQDLVVGWAGRPAPGAACGLTATLPRGQVLLVTGPSGSGKSTLAATLLGFLPPVSGRVGGVDPCRIGLLAQDETVLDTTVRENLRVADPGADDEAMLAVLDRAGLGTFVRSLPQGLDTAVGESGSRLSGGERQRLALARLLLADHDVLVLDEPTEHLDAPTAAALLDDLARLVPAHSLVVVTHSPAVVDRFAGAHRLHLEVPRPAGVDHADAALASSPPSAT
ncbi:hypothetical protein GCM10009821_18890 [Aeromicrobium halocynthiae]|uniref:Thiol reductant ABC exporter subunit CydC n=1 Tax=Aeromicrobium halocynthiae TaxID=560557 RepID=A0ABN2W3U6_9ACTN